MKYLLLLLALTGCTTKPKCDKLTRSLEQLKYTSCSFKITLDSLKDEDKFVKDYCAYYAKVPCKAEDKIVSEFLDKLALDACGVEPKDCPK